MSAPLTRQEIASYKTYLLVELARMYKGARLGAAVSHRRHAQQQPAHV